MTTVNSTSVIRNAGVSTIARDLLLLVARLGLGVMMIVHAKLAYDYGGSLTGVIDAFEASGVPLPVITGPANLFGELVGGALMIVGLAVRLIGVLMAVNMAGAWIFVHTSGLYASDRNGPELVIALGLLSLVLAASGSGRLGMDHLISRRRRQKSQTAAQGPSRAS